MKNQIQKLVTYALYPVLLASVVGAVTCAIVFSWDHQKVYGLSNLVLVLTLILVERVFPLSNDWAMTGKSFWRDLKYILLDAPTIALTRTAFGWLAIGYSQAHPGFLAQAPFWLALPLYLVTFEFFQYHYHRFSHSGQGRIGGFLWKTHSAHHLPDKVYVVMHAVFHPFNAFITATIIQGSFLVLGVSPDVVLAATMLIDLQSVISHFNVDIRAGWLNYIFIGTETHRYHHSADPKDTGNFGNTLALWDLVFGTFKYHPGQVPQRLGVSDPAKYPDSNDLLKVLASPFR